MPTEEKILERVRVLLERADHPNTPEPERDLCLNRASRLMAKHAIDEAVLRATQSETERRQPRAHKFGAATTDSVSDFWPLMKTMLGSISRNNRCEAVMRGYEATIYGFDEDVSWVEMLYLRCYHAFVTKINPRWNNDIGYDENVYNLKVAGFKWAVINDHAKRNGHPDFEIRKDGYRTGKIGSQLITAYKRHARKVGDVNLVSTQSHAAYRRSFSEGFVIEINARLEAMAAAAKDEVASSGAELVLSQSMDAIKERMYADHPHLRPMSAADAERARAAVRREYEAEQARLDAMTPAQRARHLEAEERRRRIDERRSNAYWRQEQAKRRQMYDPSGSQAGRSAAATVDLGRPGSPVNSTPDKKGINR